MTVHAHAHGMVMVQRHRPGYIYFIEAFGVQELKRIKIGSAVDPQARLRRLQVGSPVKLILMGAIRCRSVEHARSVERLANIFYKQRRRGEWFHLSRKHLAQMKSLIKEAAARPAEDIDILLRLSEPDP